MVILNPGDVAVFGSAAMESAQPTDPLANAVKLIVDEVHGVVAGEVVSVWVKNDNGAIRLTGSTSSLALFRQLEERLPRMKAIQGVKSVDLSGVKNPGW